MSCVLRVQGATFDVDEYLRRYPVKPYEVWHCGEQRSRQTLYESSGFKVVVSEAEFSEPGQQIEDAIQFLEQQRLGLVGLLNLPGVQDAVLDFGIEDRDVPAQADYFPPLLLRLAGNLNIGLVVSRYPPTPES